MNLKKWSGFLLAMCFIGPALAAFNTYPGCQNIEPEHFKYTKIADMPGDGVWEPLKIDFWTDAQDNVDVYWVERRHPNGFDWGRVRMFDASEGALHDMGPIATGDDMYGDAGVISLLIDKNFGETGWMYIVYVPPADFNQAWNETQMCRLSRFTVRDNTLDMASESTILEFPFWRGHTGGGMVWDDYGNIYLPTGDSGQYDNWVANTNHLAGKILRIRPLPVAEGSTEWGRDVTYTIPPGNFWEYWSNRFEQEGRTDLAVQYRDTANLVRPEIYVMGTRNAYHVSVDPVRQWLTFGDCGPDGTGGATEEFTFATAPINAGWPYFAGKNFVMNQDIMEVQNDPLHPINNSPSNTGVRELPPASPATYAYPQACAVGGPYYRYNPNLNSDVKMPPHFHRVWFFSEFNSNWIHAIRMSEDGQTVLEEERVSSSILSRMIVNKPLDLIIGPEGAMYIANYADFDKSNLNTAIGKLEYIGPSCDVGPDFVVEKAGCMNESDPAYDPGATHHNPDVCGVGVGPSERINSNAAQKIHLRQGLLIINVPGPYKAVMTDIAGKALRTWKGTGPAVLGIGTDFRSSGIKIIQVETAAGSVTLKGADPGSLE